MTDAGAGHDGARSFAVVGSPVAHSLSPVLHGAAYAALGLTEWEYGRREITEGELARVVAGLGDEWRGLSLTMPLKEVAFDVAATVTDPKRRSELSSDCTPSRPVPSSSIV